MWRSWGVLAPVALVAAGWVAVGLRGLPPDPAAAAPAGTTQATGTDRPTAAGTPTTGTPTLAGTRSTGTPSAGRTSAAGDLSGTAPAVDRRPPVGLRIPALGLSVRLTQLALNPDRTVEVPTDYALPGWYRLGPTPGQRGSAVILGHVDSYRGPAVFHRLRTLRPGDEVEVDLAGGTVARFAVRAVETQLKRDFPAQRVYGDHGGRSLQLVTCGGEFDRAARSYRSNVVVYTELVSVG